MHIAAVTCGVITGLVQSALLWREASGSAGRGAALLVLTGFGARFASVAVLLFVAAIAGELWAACLGWAAGFVGGAGWTLRRAPR